MQRRPPGSSIPSVRALGSFATSVAVVAGLRPRHFAVRIAPGIKVLAAVTAVAAFMGVVEATGSWPSAFTAFVNKTVRVADGTYTYFGSDTVASNAFRAHLISGCSGAASVTMDIYCTAAKEYVYITDPEQHRTCITMSKDSKPCPPFTADNYACPDQAADINQHLREATHEGACSNSFGDSGQLYTDVTPDHSIYSICIDCPSEGADSCTHVYYHNHEAGSTSVGSTSAIMEEYTSVSIGLVNPGSFAAPSDCECRPADGDAGTLQQREEADIVDRITQHVMSHTVPTQ